jgi:hypothetical protein
MEILCKKRVFEGSRASIDFDPVCHLLSGHPDLPRPRLGRRPPRLLPLRLLDRPLHDDRPQAAEPIELPLVTAQGETRDLHWLQNLHGHLSHEH